MPTYSCNCRCAWCYARNETITGDTSPQGKLLNYIDALAQQGARNCVFIGGEPTCYPDLVSLIQYTRARGISPRMMTNGRRLASRPYVQVLANAGLAACSVSIEGPENLHDETVGVVGAYRESIEGIKNLQDAGIRVNTITTISRRNMSFVVDIIRDIQSLGRIRMGFNMCTGQVGEAGQGADVDQIGIRDYADLATRIAEQFAFVRFYALVPLCCFDLTRVVPLVNAGRIKYACSIWSDAISVDPRGNVLICNHMPQIGLGNLNDEPDNLKVILKEKARLKHKFLSEAPSSKCVNCIYWNTCKGGCSMLWLTQDAEVSIPGIDVQLKAH